MSEPYWVPLGASGYPVQGALVTTLPASPVDGQEVVLTDSLTAPTYAWTLRYVAGITGPYKWIFVGGADWVSSIPAAQASGTRSTWYDLATVGPSVTVPRAGDYVAFGSASCIDNTAAVQTGIGIALGAASPTPIAYNYIATANFNSSVALQAVFTGIAAGTELRLRYAVFGTAGSATWQFRVLRVQPLRLA